MSLRMTEDEYMSYLERTGKQTARQKPKRRSKYNNKKTWVDGICFDSKKESEYYQTLKLLHQIGEIRGFCLQPEFILQEGNEEHRAITYRADFIILHMDGTFEIVDVKGYEPEQWKRTEKMFKLKYPRLRLKITK
ncbi:MAG TPA: DUF1064 domain-containing protein [Bacillota bacterium]|nr:DUF1064 domain-containing protein [Bacillota bacterium]